MQGASPAAARVAVWDLPMRLFHWALAGLVVRGLAEDAQGAAGAGASTAAVGG